MSTLNIPSTNTDPSYRYKMPRMITRIEGRGNGIKTNLVNMTDVARALKTPPEYATKFFGCELGAQSKYDPKEEKAVVNGAHETVMLQKMLDKFIEKFLLCTRCQLPETDLEVTKKGDIFADCKACGSHEMIDMSHKLCTFILKNPPNGVTSAAAVAASSADAKKAKKEAKKARKEARKAERGGVSSDEEDEEKKEEGEEGEKKEKKEKERNRRGGNGIKVKG
eukprot:GILI01012126.1.p2 GENE.GILI01012126.1~~GILI01012126.1.p2  ORF type:complete len:223 (-),score=87.79 GILI01012126.1:322-990(-)